MLARLLRKSTARNAGEGAEKHPAPVDTAQSATDALQQVLADVETHDRAGAFGASLRRIDAALAIAPGVPELALARARTLFYWGRYWESLWVCDALGESGWAHPQLTLQSAHAYLALGHHAEAESRMRSAMDADPGSAGARTGLIDALVRQGKFGEALEAWTRLFGPADDDRRRRTWMIFCRVELGDFARVETEAKRLLEEDPNQPGVWNNLGVALHGLGRRNEAMAAFVRSQEVDDSLRSGHDSFVNVAKQSAVMGHLDDCIRLLESELPQRPSTQGHVILSEALLKAGRVEEGWPQYEFRWLKQPLLYRRHGASKPMWTGQDVRGKTVLVRVEQGLGDAIQFVRYLPLLKRAGATVVLRRIPGITTAVPGVDRLVEKDEAFDYDFYVNLLSLPRLFGTTLETIPREVPYLKPDPERAARWGETIGDDAFLRVGLVWAGNPAHARDKERSMALRSLVPLTTKAGIRFYSLQKGPLAGPDAQLISAHNIKDLGSAFGEFTDTAAAISRLDLVICVDTAVAHLAGAAGRPVWLLLPKDGEWRWLDDQREDSPWYPTMRIFRQRRPGDWDDVVARVGAELARMRDESAGSMHATDRTPGRDSDVVLSEPRRASPYNAGLCAVAECRAGIFQCFPDEPVGRSLLEYGEWLPEQIDAIAPLLKPGVAVVEAGPGIGAHAADIARRIAPSGHLMLFEPRDRMHRLLTQNLSANQLVNVTVLKRALWNEPDLSASIPIDRLDDYALARLQLLKVTEASAVLPVLAGAAETLWRLRPCLLLTADDGASTLAIRDAIRPLGFRAWRHETALYRSGNFNQRSEDIFSRKRALAVVGVPEESDAGLPVLAGCKEL
jgi:Flp pilus assembly protein TadD